MKNSRERRKHGNMNKLATKRILLIVELPVIFNCVTVQVSHFSYLQNTFAAYARDRLKHLSY